MLLERDLSPRLADAGDETYSCGHDKVVVNGQTGVGSSARYDAGYDHYGRDNEKRDDDANVGVGIVNLKGGNR